MKCFVCGRPISSAESVASGLGPRCREHRTAIDQPELFAELKPTEPKGREAKEPEVIDFDRLRGKEVTESEERD
jgi:hypothetical protein